MYVNTFLNFFKFFNYPKIKPFIVSQNSSSIFFRKLNISLITSVNVCTGLKPIIIKTANNNKLPIRNVCQYERLNINTIFKMIKQKNTIKLL